MNNTISTKQLKYAITGFITASSLLTSNLYYYTKNDAWVSVLLGYIFSLVLVGIYTALVKRHPGLTLTEISEAVFGKLPGKIMTFLYFFYFLSLAYFNTRDLGDFVKGMLMQATPIMLIFAFFVMICAMAIKKGPVKMTQYGALLTLVSITAILFNSGLLINKVHPENLMPSLTLPVRDYLIGAHIVTMLPFSEIMAFTMLAPYMNKPTEFGKALRSGLLIGGAVFVFIAVRDTAVLGGMNSRFAMPSFMVVRLIDIGDVLTRLEVLYAVILTMMLFMKVSIVYYAAVSSARSLFGLQSNKPLINIIGVLIAVFALVSFSSLAEHVKWNLTAAATYSSFFLLVLPLTTLIASVVRGNRQNSMLKSGEC